MCVCVSISVYLATGGHVGLRGVGQSLSKSTCMSVSSGEPVVQRLFLLVGGKIPEVYRIEVRGHRVRLLILVLPDGRIPHATGTLEFLVFNFFFSLPKLCISAINILTQLFVQMSFLKTFFKNTAVKGDYKQ